MGSQCWSVLVGELHVSSSVQSVEARSSIEAARETSSRRRERAGRILCLECDTERDSTKLGVRAILL